MDANNDAHLITDIESVLDETEVGSCFDPYSHNISFLRKHLTHWPKNMTDWFECFFGPNLRAPDDRMYLFRELSQQTGGGQIQDHRYSFTDHNEEYHVRIREIDLTDEEGEDLGKLYLMSPHDDEITHRCLFAKITRENPTVAELSDLILQYNCTNRRDAPPKIGFAYVHLMVRFLTRHHQRLGINRIELFDNAYYRCPKDRSLGIHLEQSRQLEGQFPYYIQFGFIPEDVESAQVLFKNRQLMSKILTKDDMGLTDLCRVFNCDQTILRYIQMHQEQPLSHTLRYISRKNCQLYAHIYRILFEKCGLEILDSPLYTMSL